MKQTLINLATPALNTGKAVLNWVLRPARALILAYSYVLTGTKVSRPYTWGEI